MYVGALPPTVTVTVSIERRVSGLPAVAGFVITSSPQVPNLAVAWAVVMLGDQCPAHTGRPAGTVAVIVVSLQVPVVAVTPPIVTVPRAVPKP